MRSVGAVAQIVILVALGSRTAASQSCQLFTAAFEAIGSKSDSTILIERTAMGIPGFAFAMASTMRRGDSTLREIEPALRVANATRVPVPKCMVDSLGWRTISDSAVMEHFGRDRAGWPAFRMAYPATPRFALMSQPIIAGDTATIYVANASDILAGQGMIVRLVREPSGLWVRRSTLLLWVS